MPPPPEGALPSPASLYSAASPKGGGKASFEKDVRMTDLGCCNQALYWVGEMPDSFLNQREK